MFVQYINPPPPHPFQPKSPALIFLSRMVFRGDVKQTISDGLCVAAIAEFDSQQTSLTRKMSS